MLREPCPFIPAALLIVAVLAAPYAAFCEDADAKRLDDSGGSATATNKGISTIPNLTLGKPAALFSMTAEKHGISFEPEFRFSLEGQPWSFLFWWRYDLVRSGRFRVDVGAHPAISFKSFYVTEAGASREVTEARRFLAGEVSAVYRIGPTVSLGAYYLYSHGFEESAPSNTNYFNLSVTVSNPGLVDGFSGAFRPQVYYLNIDGEDGVYATLTVSLSPADLPISVASLLNSPIETNVSGSPDFLWNVSLIYSFDLAD